jgi:V-type H+-transporting ATPase proteolipid subunit
VFSGAGAAYATAKTGVASINVCVMRPDMFMKCLLPIIMAGVVGLYGVLATVFIGTALNRSAYPFFLGAMHLGSGLSVGFASLAAGFAIGITGEAGVRGYAQQPQLFTAMVLVLIFSEVLGLYGVIGCIMMCTNGTANVTC